MQVYNTSFEVEHKSDNSPLTEADTNAHMVIDALLSTTGIPVLSEEGKDIPYELRKNWEFLWMVDPLDGTKEFVKRNGEFTVNIALIQNGYPILGVVSLPHRNLYYFGSLESGSFLFDANKNDLSDVNSFNQLVALSNSLPLPHTRTNFVAIASRSHMSEDTRLFIQDLEREHGNVDLVSAGSSLKLCMVADGTADVYPRLAPTMEWDTAAGQAIIEAAGKSVVFYESRQRMRYNKPNLLNDWFLVS